MVDVDWDYLNARCVPERRLRCRESVAEARSLAIRSVFSRGNFFESIWASSSSERDSQKCERLRCPSTPHNVVICDVLRQSRKRNRQSQTCDCRFVQSVGSDSR